MSFLKFLWALVQVLGGIALAGTVMAVFEGLMDATYGLFLLFLGVACAAVGIVVERVRKG